MESIETAVTTSDKNGEGPPCKRMRSNSEGPTSDPESSQAFPPKASGGANSLFELRLLESMDILDEVEDIEEDQSDDGSENGELSYDSEVPEEEIDALLEEGLPEEMKGPRKPKTKVSDSTDAPPEIHYERKEKVILADHEVNHFEMLPEGWVEVIHNSGMPVYLHKGSRVCTFSKPYFLGSGSTRKHNVPLSAIPCLHYSRTQKKFAAELLMKQEKEKATVIEEGEISNDKKPESNSQQSLGENLEDSLPAGPLAKALAVQAGAEVVMRNPSIPIQNDLQPGIPIAEARVENSVEVQECESLEPQVLMEYCQQRFKFKTIKLLRFNSWADKRKYEKKTYKRRLRCLPDGTNLISIKRQDNDDNSMRNSRKEWVINPKGKSYVCILHEYVQHVLKNQPKYVFREVENAATPYAATLIINDMQYSTGYGSSKKQAKMESAKATLEVLLPELGKKIRQDNGTEEDTDLSFFDDVKIEDVRVSDLCNKTSELSPYSVLLNCLQRNFGLSGNGVESKLMTLKNQKNQFMMTVGKHTVQVPCRNKKDGKHKASQALLQKLHPHITSWGSLLRLYGNKSLQMMRDKKAEEQEITLLQANATLHQPNTSIISKLKEEMLKLKDMSKVIQSIGKFVPPEDISFPNIYGTELNNVDL